MSDEQWPYEVVAENLEEFGTSRANFNHLSDEERIAVGKRLCIAKSQAKQKDSDDRNAWKNAGRTWRRELEKKKEVYLYYCGRFGIDFDEARYIWWNYVYGGATPYMRKYLV